MEVFTKAAEYMEIPVRRTDDEPLQKLFMSVRSELNLDLKNMKQEQANHSGDGAVETGPTVPLSARKSSGVSSEGIAPFLRLAHFSDTVVKKIARKALFHTHPTSRSTRRKTILGSPSGFIFEQRVVLSEGGAITAASKTISDRMEGSGAGVKETKRLRKLKVGQDWAGTRGLVSNEGANAEEGMEEEEEEYDDYESEYSEDVDDKKDVDEKRGPKKANGTVMQACSSRKTELMELSDEEI
uniref:Uncharacterized protein n=1 Tax=Brassica oleracea var. oleracea TaxID=109376 RepID=A0A0D3AS11_BRAOL